MNKNKTSIAITLFLMFAMAISLVAIPTAAQPTMATHAFIGATPNPIGVGEETLFHVGITQQLTNVAMGWEGLSVTIERPDGTTETLRDITTDSTGGTGVVYVPTMEGNYTVQTHFPEQVTESGKTAPGTTLGTVLLASSSDKLTLIVTDTPREYWPGVPLPTEYWTRPIDAQFYEWASISASWLDPLGGAEVRHAPYNHGPESAHILWTQQVEMGGLAGGELDVHSFECGAAYVDKAPNRIIVAGILFYNKFPSRGEPYLSNNEVTAIDMRTGEELWSKPLIGRVAREETTANVATVAATNRVIDGVDDRFPDGQGRRLSHGQLFYWDSYNYHGAYAIIWTVTGNTWQAFDAINGRWIYTIMNVPSGTTVYGPKGEIYRYTQNLGAGWFALWNVSAIVAMAGSWNPHGNIYNASGTGAAAQGAWTNITIPAGLPGSLRDVFYDDRIIGTTVPATTSPPKASPTSVFWGISLKPGEEGRLMFNKTWTLPANLANENVTIAYHGASAEDDVIVIGIKETRQHIGFSATTGDQIWGPTEPQNYLDFYQFEHYGTTSGKYPIADGKLFSGGTSGITYCYDVKTGELLWTYEMKDIYGEVTWGVNYPSRSPQGFVADGKYYSGYWEHSPIDPKPRGAPFFCVDIETGEEVWSIYMSPASYRMTGLIGDSTIAVFNTYDNRMYAIGKGPSATTVTAPDTGVPLGTSVLVRGIVTDVSPGTNDAAITMRFPNGVPAVADESMSEWMQYVYMQFPRPADVEGLEVVISVLDPNNNYYEVGKTMTDDDGFFKLSFEPEVPGDYIVIAEFEGSKSYHASHAKTAVSVMDAPATTPEPTPTPESVADMYFLPVSIGLLVAIIAVGAILVLMLKKR
jgi:outer membrane protein assembly factor BamB